ncbi:MAG TPA: (d)CMP kinase [Burkholderiales bacterium]|nr:(d)CMP kinase [Burkholderiales bacterium]
MSRETTYDLRFTNHGVAVPVLAIDGPSGSGKGTVGQLLAERLGWHFLDSGALYRALGIAANRAGEALLQDADALARLAVSLDIRFMPQPGGAPVRVILNGTDVGDAIRTEDSGRLASIVAAVPQARAALLQKQHAFRQAPGLVADGRDMGSTVFPDAILKIFVTASAEIRAERRYKQLKEKGFDANLRRLLDEIRERDARDAARTASPLKPAADACILDTSSLDIPDVVDRIHGLLQERLAR